MNSILRKIEDFEGVALPADVLERAGIAHGDTVEIIEVPDGIKIVKADTEHARQMRSAREGMERYREALAKLAR